MLEHEYQLAYFQKNGFHRRICTSCKMPFWSQDAARQSCGDPPCATYEFIGKPVTKRKYNLTEMREAFLRFHEERGHKRVARYPVIARWRDDIYLTIASIADFQPHVTSGVVPPPANPLCISQPCIRLNDLDSVGKSGRHLTCFEMMAHHVFNSPEKEIYWKDRTVELCHEFLTKTLGIDGKLITYKENPWSGGGNAGPAVEVLVAGLEVATLVFMNMQLDPQGSIELKGETYSLMPLRIVDTGYGLERLVWASNGAENIYEALWPDLLKQWKHLAHLDTQPDARLQAIQHEVTKLAGLQSVDTNVKLIALRAEVARKLGAKGIQVTPEELDRQLRPLENLYALADHSRVLAFMLGDGIVPSNVKGGYLARLLIRRALRLIEELRMDTTLVQLLDAQLQALSKDFPELRANRDTMMRIVDLETERYRETIEKGTRLVQAEAKKLGKGATISVDKLLELYDSNGLNPEIVKQVAEPMGVKVEVPDDFFSQVANRHSSEKRGAKAQEQVPKELKALPKTKLVYYENPLQKEFDAVVLYAQGKEVVLDQTAFYPEGGGQPSDSGFLSGRENALLDVTRADTKDGVVIHTVEGGKLRKGDVVHGRVDWGKRLAHTRAHTATHITLAASRRVLGNHVWQTGAQKGADVSRIDITHFKRITDEEMRQIETLANMAVMEDMQVEKLWLDRDEAEKKFGFQLYQGGIPTGKVVRVVRIQEFDVECCGGTHVKHTAEVGPIKLLRAEPIQDGVHRIEFSAGMAAVRRFQERDVLIQKAAETLGVTPDKLPLAAERFFTEWRQLRKQVEELTELAAAGRKGKLLAQAQLVGKVKLVVSEEQATMEQLLTLAGELVKEPGVVAILGSAKEGAKVVVARSKDVDLHAGEVVREASKAAGGGGGGKPELAQGGGPDASKLAEALQVAAEQARKRLG
ncbi:MAG: alanine--tRNA ligase [Halobacteriales archaeon]|nr:alanine--tRNA ligase [Halobacteriales archaeon]